MQLKRIILSLLVAVMMISMAVVAVSAANTTVGTFDVRVEAVDAEGYLPVTSEGTVEAKIVVTNNPGVSVATFDILFDTEEIEYVSNTAGDLYNLQFVKSVNSKVCVATNMLAEENVTELGTVVTLTFKVAESFTGDKVKVDVDSVIAYDETFNEVPATGTTGETTCEHKNVTILEAQEPTCLEAGKTEGKVCATCGEVLVAQEEIDATGHTAGAEATCTTAQTCTVCNAEMAPAKGHAEVGIVEAFDATCAASGMTAGKMCSVCNIVIEKPVAVAKKAHTEVTLAGVPATCTTAGLTEGKMCSACKMITVEQTAIAATGHTEVTLAGVPATCTTAGLTEGKMCSTCKMITVEQTVIAATGHTAGAAATCTAAQVCTVCKAEMVAAKAHTEVTIEAVAPSCTAAGSTEGKKCSACGVVTVAPEVVQPTGHNLEEIPAVEPTYSEAGSTAGSKCTVCNEVVDATGEIPAKSLAWLWVLIICVVVAGGGMAACIIIMKKKA